MRRGGFDVARDVSGRTALVTGGTDGVGKEIAQGLVNLGVHVIVAGRDPEKGSKVVHELRSSSKNAVAEFLQADLSLMADARRLALQVAVRFPALHYLVHSAGVVRGRHELTGDGIESNFAINYLSRFVLTSHLLPQMEIAGHTGASARVVMIGGAAQNGKIHWDDVNLTANFTTLRAVWQFCRANDLFTSELARRLVAADIPQVTITSLKLGVVKTNIRREFPRWMKLFVPLLFDPFLALTPRQAAGSALSLLLDEDLESVSGALFSHIKTLKPLKPCGRQRDTEAGCRLWDLSESLTAHHSMHNISQYVSAEIESLLRQA